MKKMISGLLCLFAFMSFQTVHKTTTAAKTNPTANKTGTTATVSGLKASTERGRQVYQATCLACHQVDGGGVPHLNAPLDGAMAVRGNDKAKLIRTVLKGVSQIEIEGETYSNIMVPQAQLTDQQIADVLTYIRNSWTNKASAVTAAEVKLERAKTK